MKNKFLMSFLFMLLPFVLFVGCSSENSSVQKESNEVGSGSVEKEEEITLRIWFGRDAFIPGDNFKAFMEENPNIKVETDVIPLETVVSEFIRSAQAGNAPDIMQTSHDTLGPLVTQGLLLDMTPHLNRWESEDPESFNNMMESAWDMASWEGVPYGLALHIGPYFHVYRQDWFEQAGLAPTETWEDVFEVGKNLTDNHKYGFSLTAGRGVQPSWFISHFRAMGGEYNEYNAPIINSEAGIYLIEFYQRLIREGIVNPEAIAWGSGEMRGSFIGGNAAMATIGDNIFPTIQESLEFDVEWNVTDMPYREGAKDQAKTTMAGWPYMVSSGTKHEEAVLKLLQYMSRTEIVGEVARRYQPTTNIAVMSESTYIEAKPWAPKMTEAFVNATPLPAHLNQQGVYEILQDIMQEALSNPDADPASIAEKYQLQIDALN